MASVSSKFDLAICAARSAGPVSRIGLGNWLVGAHAHGHVGGLHAGVQAHL